jgi:hypothetical protein
MLRQNFNGLVCVQARTNAEKLRAIENGVLQYKKHLEWRRVTNFLNPKELQAWHSYCFVPGVYDGFVVLRVNIGALLREVCKRRCPLVLGAFSSLL